MKRPAMRYSIRAAVTLFGILCVANTFFDWSFPAWFGIFGPPAGLVSPGVDKWVITPLAMAVYLLQYPSYAVLYNVGALSSVQAPASVIIASLLSLALYLPAVLWLKRRRVNQA